jgi:hypothetical protein
VQRETKRLTLIHTTISLVHIAVPLMSIQGPSGEIRFKMTNSLTNQAKQASVAIETKATLGKVELNGGSGGRLKLYDQIRTPVYDRRPGDGRGNGRSRGGTWLVFVLDRKSVV